MDGWSEVEYYWIIFNLEWRKWDTGCQCFVDICEKRHENIQTSLWGRKLRGPHANPWLQWEGWPWPSVGWPSTGIPCTPPCVAAGESLCLVHKGEAKHAWWVLKLMLSSYFCAGGNTDLNNKFCLKWVKYNSMFFNFCSNFMIMFLKERTHFYFHN